MDLESAAELINEKLAELKPTSFSSTWIHQHTPKAYRYIYQNIRLETGDIDWDLITKKLDRSYQKHWRRYRGCAAVPYANRAEVDAVLERYRDKLYTFIVQTDEDDKRAQDWLVIRLVRLSQRGNTAAQEELLYWVKFITDDWLDRYPQMYRWKAYEAEVEDRVKACIRCYKYTGSFLGYLFKTLEYSAKGKPPLVSLDDKVLDGAKTRIEYARVAE